MRSFEQLCTCMFMKDVFGTCFLFQAMHGTQTQTHCIRRVMEVQLVPQEGTTFLRDMNGERRVKQSTSSSYADILRSVKFSPPGTKYKLKYHLTVHVGRISLGAVDCQG